MWTENFSYPELFEYAHVILSCDLSSYDLSSYDILLNMNKQHVTLLVFLDLIAAFDTVDHVILLRAHGSLGIGGITVIEWYRSYLSGCGQRISVRGCTSERFNLDCGCLLYTSPSPRDA